MNIFIYVIQKNSSQSVRARKKQSGHLCGPETASQRQFLSPNLANQTLREKGLWIMDYGMDNWKTGSHCLKQMRSMVVKTTDNDGNQEQRK